MIIDFHAHIFPDALAERAIATLKTHSPDAQNFTDGTAADLCKSMHQSGITKSVLLPVATKPSQVPSINNDCTLIKNPEFIAFGALHPKTTNYEEEIAFLKANHIPGVKFHPEYQDFYIETPSMFPMYDALSSAGLIASFHAGKDPGPFTCDHALPSALKNIHRNFPNLKIVAAHLGGWKLWESVEETLCGLPIYFDTAAVHKSLPDQDFIRIIRKHGVEKILFGTDSPWYDQENTLKWIVEMQLSDTEKEAILSANAINLLYQADYSIPVV